MSDTRSTKPPLSATPTPSTKSAEAESQAQGKASGRLRRELVQRPFGGQSATLAPPGPWSVQRPTEGAPRTSVQDIAREGARGPGGALPHVDRIQAAFGRHDLSGVRAHTDGGAADAAGALGAEAYATGSDVAFRGAPSLHTAAHEAAHVVQQREGVQLAGGVGKDGDAFEKHADAVADRVVAGTSAEDLLDQAPGGAAAGGAVQRRQAPGAVVQLKGDKGKTEETDETESSESESDELDPLPLLDLEPEDPEPVDIQLDEEQEGELLTQIGEEREGELEGLRDTGLVARQGKKLKKAMKRDKRHHRQDLRHARKDRSRSIKRETVDENELPEETRSRQVRKKVQEERRATPRPLTLHDDQGPSLILAELRQAMVEYVKATRQKEGLRTELGVNKLKKSRKKKEGRTGERVEEVRLDKETAKKRYTELRKAAEKYLSETEGKRRLAFQKEIKRIDQQVLGVSDRRDDKRQRVELLDRKKKRGKVGKIKRVTRTLTLGETDFGSLQRRLQPLAEAGVGARNFTFKVGVSFEIGVGKGSKIKLGGGFVYRGKTDIQDDRRLRVTSSYGAYGSASTELAAVVEGELGGEYMYGTTNAYVDVDHWAADVAFQMGRLKKALDKLKHAGRSEDLDQDLEGLVNEEERDELLATRAIAQHDKVTRVTSHTVSGGVDVGMLGMGVSGGGSKTWQTFERDGQEGKKQRRQATTTVKNLSFSPASNISVGFTWTTIKGHPNPDNNGDYVNVNLSLSSKAAVAFSMKEKQDPEATYARWETALRKKLGASQDGSDGDGLSLGGIKLGGDDKKPKKVSTPDTQGVTGKYFANLVQKDLAKFQKTLVSQNVPFELESSLSKSGQLSVEWNFVSTLGKNRLQYRRVSSTMGKGLSGSVPMGSVGGAKMSLDVGVSKSQTLMKGEKLGTETSTYLQTVFDGLRLRDKRDEDLGRKKQGGGLGAWAGYVASHKPELTSIYGAVGVRKGGFYREIVDARRETEQRGQEETGALQTACQNAVAAGGDFLHSAKRHASEVLQDDTEAFDTVTNELTNYFEAQAKVTALVEGAKWKDM